MLNKRSLSIFVASTLGAATLCLPALSEAYFFRRVHASACRSEGGDVDQASSGAMSNNSDTESAVLYCPVPDDTSTYHDGVDVLAVYGWDAHSDDLISAMACTTNMTVTGGSCGVPSTSSKPQVTNYALSLSLSDWWANGSDFAYVQVTLPPKQAGQGASTLRGITLTNL